MRTLGRIMLVLIIIVPTLIAGHRIWVSLQWNELAAVLSGRIEAATPSNAYLSINDQWMEFPLSGLGRALRIRTNAITDAQSEQQEEAEWWYAFEYQLLDADGKRLQQGVYHHRTRLTLFRDPDDNRLISRNFLLNPQLDPTDGRSMMVHFGEEGQPTRVRLRPLQKDPVLKALLFRVYERVPNPRHQLGYLWQRLGESKKVRLAQSSVYGLDLLLEQEKQNLLRYEWKAMGPLGVENEQYKLKKLYLSRELEGESLEQNVLPYGLYSDSTARGMIPLPEGDWKITLEFFRLDDEGSSDAEVKIHWYGKGVAQRWQSRVPAHSGKFRLDPDFNSGLLEIIVPVPMVVRAWISSNGTELEITPEPLHLRSYIVDSSGPVTVDIDHVAERATPFRVDLRTRLEAGRESLARTLDYELLGPGGKLVRSGQLPAHYTPSNYDRLATAEPGINLSEPVRYYFDLPSNVTAVRFSARHELLLTTYSRPPAMVREVRVPEDYQRFGDDQDKQPAWFVLRPSAAERLRREFRSVLLMLQQRPPETDPRLLAGDYDWTLYQPVGNWRARLLLVPRKEELPVRDQSVSAVYRELSPEQTVPLNFRGLPGHLDINPSLLFMRNHDAPLEVKVMLGGKLHFSTWIAGSRGELRLPPVSAGRAQLSIAAAEPVRWLINQADAQAPAYLRRLAMQVTGSGLDFEYEKQSSDPELLSGALYFSSGERARLRVTITGERLPGNGPWQDWTFHDRLFDLRRESSDPVPFLNSDMNPLAGGHRFVLPLGSDLPPGKYRIGFTLEGESEGYLTLYRLTPGQTERRIFFKERAYANQAGL